jgi:hypothetical protein
MTSTGRICRVALLVFALLIFCAAPVWSQGYERKVEVSWDFSTAATTFGWTPEVSAGASSSGYEFPCSLEVSGIQTVWDSYIAASPIPYLMSASARIRGPRP